MNILESGQVLQYLHWQTYWKERVALNNFVKKLRHRDKYLECLSKKGESYEIFR